MSPWLVLLLLSAAADGGSLSPAAASPDAGVVSPDAGVVAPPPRPPGAPVRWMDLSPSDRARVLRAVVARPLADRLLENSRKFLDTPYLHSPLGEGGGFDADPVERFDAVDCLTFVEQTMAMSLAERPGQAPALLQAIRYGAAPTYADRNHLMEAQWLPANVAKGFVRDVTARYGGEDVVETQKVLTPTTWTSVSSQALRLPRARQLTGAFKLQIIPLEKVMAHARSIPSGTILLVVREDLPLKATRVTHLGFVVQKKKRTVLRHAARSAYGRVVDEDLETFLLRNARYDKWKVSGVALYEVVAPPADEAVADTAPR